jgi:hypothetical protein
MRVAGHDRRREFGVLLGPLRGAFFHHGPRRLFPGLLPAVFAFAHTFAPTGFRSQVSFDNTTTILRKTGSKRNIWNI